MAQLQLLRPAEVAALIGIHRVTLYTWVRKGRFPAPFKVGQQASRFRESDVAAWIDARASGESAGVA